VYVCMVHLKETWAFSFLIIIIFLGFISMLEEGTTGIERMYRLDITETERTISGR